MNVTGTSCGHPPSILLCVACLIVIPLSLMPSRTDDSDATTVKPTEPINFEGTEEARVPLLATYLANYTDPPDGSIHTHGFNE